jgi:hypothetical protein
MLVGHSRTCDVSALRLCLFPLELMNGREIATADVRMWTDGESLQHPTSIDYLRNGALQICIGLQSFGFSVAVCDVQFGGRLDWNNLRCIEGGRFAICNRPSLYIVGLPVSGT